MPDFSEIEELFDYLVLKGLHLGQIFEELPPSSFI